MHACHCKQPIGGECTCQVRHDKQRITDAIEELGGATPGELFFHLTNDMEEAYVVALLNEMYQEGGVMLAGQDEHGEWVFG